MDKTPGQVAYESQGMKLWHEESRRFKTDYEEMAQAVIAHVRPQIEAKARAVAMAEMLESIHNVRRQCASKTGLKYEVAIAFIEEYGKQLSALATLPPGHVVVPVEPDSNMLDAGHVELINGGNENFPTQRACNVFKAMIAARPK